MDYGITAHADFYASSSNLSHASYAIAISYNCSSHRSPCADTYPIEYVVTS